MSEIIMFSMHAVAAAIGLFLAIDGAKKRNIQAFYGWLCTTFWAMGGLWSYV